MDSNIRMINISVELCGVLMCLMGIAVVLIGRRMERKTSRYFAAIFSCLGIYLTSNICGLMFKGRTDTFGFYSVRISNFCEFFFGYLLSLFFTLYIVYCVSNGKSNKRLKEGIFALFTTEVLMLVVSQFTGIFYYFDSSNVYHRGDLFWISQVTVMCSAVINTLLIIFNRKMLSKKEIMAFSVYIILPLVALTVQIFYYGLLLTHFSEILSAFVMFIFILDDQTEKYCEKERENSDMRVAIMLSQIQPHFLYNTLTSIYCLCDKNPKAAKQAISEFSKYLRGNFESVGRKTPIMLEDELTHVQSYLALEKMRFEDELEVVYDIKAQSFLLPALTIQPLVENAVKHGVGDAPNGGTVKLSTREFPDYYEIEIADNGVGFDTENFDKSEETHIGIENVRSRLELMCNGTLSIESYVGKGTTATIRIPKGDS